MTVVPPRPQQYHHSDEEDEEDAEDPNGNADEIPPDIDQLLQLTDNADDQLSDIEHSGGADGEPSDTNLDEGAQDTGATPVVTGAPGQLSDSD